MDRTNRLLRSKPNALANRTAALALSSSKPPRRSVLFALGVLCLVASCASNEVKTSHPFSDDISLDEFLPLFDGESLAGWWGCATEDPRQIAALSVEERAERRLKSLENIRAHWKVEDSVLINDGEGLFLTTEKEYGDFELLLEFRTVAGADSGVYLRGIPQVQIWDTTEAGGKWHIGAKLGSGGLWNNSPGTPGKDPLVHADNPFGEWNQLRIVMAGEIVSVWLNGKLTVDQARLENYFDRSTPIPRTGPIQLQTHGGEIRWRNVYIREIDAAEANQILTAHTGNGTQSIFDGALTGEWNSFGEDDPDASLNIEAHTFAIGSTRLTVPNSPRGDLR